MEITQRGDLCKYFPRIMGKIISFETFSPKYYRQFLQVDLAHDDPLRDPLSQFSASLLLRGATRWPHASVWRRSSWPLQRSGNLSTGLCGVLLPSPSYFPQKHCNFGRSFEAKPGDN